jgi:NitT/TauT family transport system permease protein
VTTASREPASGVALALPRGRGRVAWLREHGLPPERLAPAISLPLFLLVWQAAVTLLEVPAFLLPAPSAIFLKFTENGDYIVQHLLFTAQSALLGLGLALVIGSLLAIAIGYSRTMESAVYPYIVVTQVTPIVAIAPLVAIWFGFGLLPKVIVAFLISFFPIVVNLALGLRSPDEDFLALMRSLNASELETFLKVRVPYSLPLLFAGLRVAGPASVIGAIVAEFVGSDQGLGYVILFQKAFLQTVVVFEAMIAAAALGITIFATIVLLERLLVPWHQSQAR